MTDTELGRRIHKCHKEAISYLLELERRGLTVQLSVNRCFDTIEEMETLFMQEEERTVFSNVLEIDEEGNAKIY